MAALLSLTAIPSRRAHADDEELAALFAEPVETTSGKSAGSAAIAPALSVSITAEDLRRHGIRTLAEAYNFLTVGLIGQETLGEPEVGGRGLGFAGDKNKHVLLLINGHTTNNQENGASLHGHALGLPMEMIDHIEVVLGPGSVLYGANAMLGVVNVVTKRAKDYAGVHVIATGAYSPSIDRAHDLIAPALTQQYGRDIGSEYRLGLGVGRELELRGMPMELTAQIEYYALKGPTLQWGPQLNKGLDFGPRAPLGSWGGATRNNYYAQIPSGYARLIAGHFEATLPSAMDGSAPSYSSPTSSRTSPPSTTSGSTGAMTERCWRVDWSTRST
jgi:outer membrane receptor for ferrienterochelin and colicins